MKRATPNKGTEGYKEQLCFRTSGKCYQVCGRGGGGEKGENRSRKDNNVKEQRQKEDSKEAKEEEIKTNHLFVPLFPSSC